MTIRVPVAQTVTIRDADGSPEDVVIAAGDYDETSPALEALVYAALAIDLESDYEVELSPAAVVDEDAAPVKKRTPRKKKPESDAGEQAGDAEEPALEGDNAADTDNTPES